MTAALILAGGKATRLGGIDKAFLPLNGKPLIEHLLTRLRRQAQHIAISANGDASRFAAYNLPVLPDQFQAKGPLAGLAAGLAWAAAIGEAELLTVPVDTPFIPENLLRRLTPGPSAATYQARQHHLVALWPTGFLPELENFLARPGDYKVRDALALAKARPAAFTGPSDPFLNINRPEDLTAAEQAARS